MEGYRWGKTFLNAIIFGTIVFSDKGIDDALRVTYNSNSFPVKSSKVLSLLGAEVGLGFTTLWLGKGLLLNQNKSTETSLLALQAALTATIWNRAVKYATLRERPYSAYANNTDQFNIQGFKSKVNLYGNSDFHSLGSGHTATAFALATVFAEQYQDIPLVKVICYTLAATVGVSRMLIHKHWSSDVLLGAAIGYGCGKQVTSFKQKFYKNNSKKYKIDTSISPFAISNKVFPTLSLTASLR